MSEVNEYRVRPVQRFVLTHYHESAAGRIGGVRTIGEFPNADAANEVAGAMRSALRVDALQAHVEMERAARDGAVRYPLPPAEPDGVEYAIVGNSLGDEATVVHYAYNQAEADARKALCQEKFGGTFNVFRRVRGA